MTDYYSQTEWVDYEWEMKYELTIFYFSGLGNYQPMMV